MSDAWIGNIDGSAAKLERALAGLPGDCSAAEIATGKTEHLGLISNLSSLRLDPATGAVVAVAVQGLGAALELELGSPVPTAGVPNPKWLHGVLTETRRAFRAGFEAAWRGPPKPLHQLVLDGSERASHPSVCLLIAAARFSYEIETLVRNSTLSAETAGAVECRLRTELELLVKASRDAPKTRLARTAPLITALIHQVSACRQLAWAVRIDGGSPGSATAAKWASFIKHHVDDDGAVTVRSGAFSVAYGWELSSARRLVVTSLTTRVYGAAMAAFCAGGALRLDGPPGSGKSEVIKDLAAELGRRVRAIDCSKIDAITAVKRAADARGDCFDGELVILESVDKISAAQLDAEFGPEFGSGSDCGALLAIITDPTSSATSPNGWLGSIPVVKMIRPELRVVTQGMLAAAGFVHAAELSKELSYTMEWCSSALSKQVWYNFGLRCIKQVVAGAALNLRAPPPATIATLDAKVELWCLHRSLILTLLPTLCAADAELFGEQLMSQYETLTGVALEPSCPKTWLGSAGPTVEQLTESVAGLDAAKLLSATLSRHAVAVVPPPGQRRTGTTVEFITTVANAAAKSVEVVRAQAAAEDAGRAVTCTEFYGGYDANTGGWVDGAFTKAMRLAVANSTWIVVDARLPPPVLDRLNSVLDDNKKLVVPGSGEVLVLPPGCRVILVERTRFAAMSPAQFFRLQIVMLAGCRPVAGDLKKLLLTGAGNPAVNGHYSWFPEATAQSLGLLDTLKCEKGIWVSDSGNGCWIGFQDCGKLPVEYGSRPEWNKWVVFDQMGVTYAAHTGGLTGCPPQEGRWELAEWAVHFHVGTPGRAPAPIVRTITGAARNCAMSPAATGSAPTDATAISVKIKSGDQNWIFKCSETSTVHQLRAKIGKVCRLDSDESTVKITWQDCDGDRITVATDRDLVEAFEHRTGDRCTFTVTSSAL